ncbi:MAG: peptide chain release factor N(5)-glutamine methyltransferase [Dehalococcoidales bacterium]|nr:peptide chain release factor N(5)-glutamine methyltransferase [Dehalococcoidales bacterium]
MTVKESLSHARKKLAAGNIEDAHIEGELLLRQALGLNRVELYLALEDGLNQQQEEAYRHLVERRLNGEPTAYITGHREFYSLDFCVNADVLIPRPETELLVEKTIALAKKHRAPVIADIGTGCGAIAITLSRSLPQAKIYATDISVAALEVARLNCLRHGVADRICLLRGDMLETLPEAVDFMVANLPYVKKTEMATSSFEPAPALDGGTDGLREIRRLCHQAKGKLRPGGSLLVEIGYGQKEPVTALLTRLFPSTEIEVIPDLSGIDRLVSMAC